MMNSSGSKPGKKRIKAKLSKIQFPDVCPVCTDSAEDLVFITIVEKHDQDDYISSSFFKSDDKTSAALNAARGATTFAVPTCLAHGSKSVRSIRTKSMAAVGFFIFLYPIIYYLLQLNVAIYYARPIMPPLTGLVIMLLGMVAAIVYGLYPRALERKLKFEEISKIKDHVILSISNSEYQSEFLEMNGMNADIVTSIDLKEE
jgi:hypothetical protein